jgi:integrase
MNKILTETLKAVRMTALATEQVLCNQDGVPYRFFRTARSEAVRKAGLTDFTFHELHHTYASWLVMRGWIFPRCKNSWESRVP